MAEDLVRISPDILTYVDEEHTKLTLELVIPGVAQKDIDLKMHDDSFYLSAPTSDVSYVAAYSFCCPVNPGKAQATYNNGLLTIEVPFKDPMDDAIKIPIKAKQAVAKAQLTS